MNTSVPTMSHGAIGCVDNTCSLLFDFRNSWQVGQFDSVSAIWAFMPGQYIMSLALCFVFSMPIWLLCNSFSISFWRARGIPIVSPLELIRPFLKVHLCSSRNFWFKKVRDVYYLAIPFELFIVIWSFYHHA